MKNALRIAGIFARWLLAALATWWFFWFITLIGTSSDGAHELAGQAIGKAVFCGGAAAILFYRAKREKASDAATVLVHLKPTAQRASPEQLTTTEQPDKASVPEPPTDEPNFKSQEISSEPEPRLAVQPPLPTEVQAEPAGTSDRKSEDVLTAVGVGVLGVVLMVVLVVVLMRTSAPQMSAPQSTDNTTSNGSNDQSPFANATDNPPQSPTPPCPTGLPANTQIVPIDDVTTLSGSDGRINDSYTKSPEGYFWNFTFVIANQTAVAQPTRRFDGYCVTALEIEVDFQGENRKAWQLTAKQNLGSFYTYLSPGWKTRFDNVDLRPATGSTGQMTAWKIVKAWGFPLNPASIPQ